MQTALLTLAAALIGASAAAAEWSDPQTILRGRDKVVTYRATVENGWLLVEAKHEPGWHTYAMDNLRRAQEKTGKENPSTELNTAITIAEGGELAGKWRQSEPKDLSTPAIRWYTWGFENTAYFAAPIKTTADTFRIVINAQSCNESACAMVEDLEIAIPIAETTESAKDAPRANLIPVVAAPADNTETD